MTVNRRSLLSMTLGGAAFLTGCTNTNPNMVGSDGTRRVSRTTRSPSRLVPVDYFDTTPAPFPQFASVPDRPSLGFNFQSWQRLIAKYVIDFGPSDRVSRGRPAPAMGTKFVKGHASSYRSEGNRIPFMLFEDEDVRRLSRAREVLEELGNTAPLGNFSWSDQLAFWFNLHNAALIEQMALHYPTRYPERIALGPQGLPLHHAKIVTIAGTPLSLRDIRVEIVYRHWRHPAAIYGFFHGTVGGPSIRKGAYHGARLTRQLADSAGEFVNSLRGERDFRSHIGVSRLYEETLRLFPDFQQDLRKHLSSFAGNQVGELLDSNAPLRIKQYDNRIADLSGGERDTTTSSRTPSTGIAPTDIGRPQVSDRLGSQMIASITQSSSHIPGLPDHANRLMLERRNKFQTLQSRFRRRRGTVTITDLPTSPVE